MNGFFSIRVGNETDADRILQSVCDAAYSASVGASRENFKNFTATDTTELESVFEKIQGNVTHLLCNNVAVTDTLSDYVQPVVDASPSLVVTNKNGEVVSVDQSKAWVSYEETTKTLKINFAPEYELEAGYTYKATLKVEPTAKAYEEYADSGYPNVSDANTGTHQSSEGFYSNGEAKITYAYNGVNQTNYFPKPVVQVDPQTLTIEKTVIGLEGDALNTLKNQLVFAVTVNGSTTNYTLSEFTVTQNTTNKETKYKLEIPGLMPGATYSITETGYDMPLYDESIAPANTCAGTIAKGENTASFINTYTPSVGSLTITKKLQDSNGNNAPAASNVTFLFQISGGGKTYNVGVTVNENASTGTATINNLPAGKYTVTEILVPTGYTKDSSNPADGEVTVSGDTGKITFTNTVTGGDDFTKDDGMVINQFTYKNGDWHWNKVS